MDFFRELEYALRTAMVLSNCATITALRRAPTWIDASLERDARALRAAVSADESTVRQGGDVRS